MIVDTLKSLVPPRVRHRLKGPYFRLCEVVDDFRGDGALMPPLHARGTVGDGDFLRLGQDFARYFRRRAGLLSTESVLDIGSGIGRMAIPLTGYLTPQARYEGFDVMPYGVQWCQRKITRRFPNFRFQLFDVRNTAYNPHGRLDPTSFPFPYESESFDFAFATSVFTHLTGATAENYFRELSRCLAPGGRALLTFFLLNEHSREARKAKRAKFRFRYRHDGCFIDVPEKPEAAVAYDETRLFKLLRSHRLRVEAPVNYGSWAGKDNGISSQDLVLVRKLTGK